MFETMRLYRKLQDRLSWVRLLNAGRESEEEEQLLEEMDGVWWKLADHERAVISAEPPRGDLIHEETQADVFVDVDVSRNPGRPARELLVA